MKTMRIFMSILAFAFAIASALASATLIDNPNKDGYLDGNNQCVIIDEQNCNNMGPECKRSFSGALRTIYDVDSGTPPTQCLVVRKHQP